jgi:hypothetical protein
MIFLAFYLPNLVLTAAPVQIRAYGVGAGAGLSLFKAPLLADWDLITKKLFMTVDTGKSFTAGSGPLILNVQFLAGTSLTTAIKYPNTKEYQIEFTSRLNSCQNGPNFMGFC